jgi:hypothetical protein
MKRIVLLLGLLLWLAPFQDAQAQFWKRHKKERGHKHAVKPKVKEENKILPKKKKREIDYPQSVFKNRYRIDVLLPLYLSELVKGEEPVYKKYTPEKVITGVNFYEGIKLAADTLTKQGFNLDIHIHDVTAPELLPEKITKNGVLEGSDLILGALQSYQIKPIADYAKANHINFISILSPADAEVKANPYFTIFQPTLATHIKKLRTEIFKKYPDQPILLFYRTEPLVDSAAFNFAYHSEEKKFEKLAVNKLPSYTQLEERFDSTITNVIFMPILDYSYAQTLLKKIAQDFPNYAFEVYGLPSWRFMTSLKEVDAFPNIGVNYSNPFYYDMSNTYCKDVLNAYRRNFKGGITELTLRGYEALVYYAYMLKNYGTVFNEKKPIHQVSFSKYDVVTQWTEDNDLLYNENTHFYLYRFQGGSYMITK